MTTSVRDSDDVLTLLIATGRRQTKKIKLVEEPNGRKRLSVIAAERAKRFTHERVTLDEKGLMLAALARRRDAFIVMGDPVPDWEPGQRNARRSRQKADQSATLVETKKRWMPIDIDSVRTPLKGPAHDGHALATEMLERLGLEDVHALWQLTGSHGIDGKTRLRLWVRLKEGATLRAMKAWASATIEQHEEALDLSIYRPAQPIYTASPVIVRGAADPIGGAARTGVVKGKRLDLRKLVPASAWNGKSVSESRRQETADGVPSDEHVEAIRNAGLYLRYAGDGHHFMVCPWRDEHTSEGGDGDTCYMQAGYNGKLEDAFKCLHSHCSERGLHQLRTKLGLSDFTQVITTKDGTETPKWAYVHRLEQYWDSSDGRLVSTKAFDTEMISTAGPKRMKMGPTERFLRDPMTLKVKDVAFLPGEERIVELDNGVKVLNTYVDLRVKHELGDASPWVEHLEALVVEVNQREWLMDWLSYCYQYPGRKIVTAPILYGPDGTGKTSVFDVLGKCLGLAHVSKPTTLQIESQFNGWAYRKLLAIVEELKGDDGYRVIENLKPIVTNPRIDIRIMYTDTFSVDNCVNVACCTNHMRALPVTVNDRRFAMIETGYDPGGRHVTEKRMRKLHKWLEREQNLSVVAGWFASRDVSKFNPMMRAPTSDLKRAVALSSKTQLEQAIELCAFMPNDGLVSSPGLRSHLERNNVHIDEKSLHLVQKGAGWRWVGQYMHGGRLTQVWSTKEHDALKQSVSSLSREELSKLLESLSDAAVEFAS